METIPKRTKDMTTLDAFEAMDRHIANMRKMVADPSEDLQTSWKVLDQSSELFYEYLKKKVLLAKKAQEKKAEETESAVPENLKITTEVKVKK